MGTVFKALRDARVKWHFIGLELKIDPGDLDSIDSKFRGDPAEGLRCVLDIYLKRANPKPTWNHLADALDSEAVGFGQLAEQMRRNSI